MMLLIKIIIIIQFNKIKNKICKTNKRKINIIVSEENKQVKQ